MIGLIILDGWGISNCKKYNAIEQANIQNFRRLLEIYPNTALRANGLDVGLPEGQMGNSEVGHLNIGAGRIVYQDLTRITRDIQNGDFFKNEALVYALEKAKTEGKALHIMGLLSDGGVHSHITHLYALLEMAKRFNLPHVYIHVFLDGRDTPLANALVYIKELEEKILELNTGKIATVSGRYYAMDRDKRWERTEQAYNAIVLGEGVKADSAVKAVEASYILKETDEFVRPTVIIDSKGEPVGTVKEGDSIIFFNFRPDRARQLTKAFVDKDFEGFKRKKGYFRVYFVCMTRYDDEIRDVKVAYEPEIIKNTLGEIISRNKMKQLRIAETEKYAHVTYFFNGGEEKPFPGEDRILIPSPKVPTYDLKPEMSAYEVTETVIEKINNKEYDFIVLNYANPDMVGHTGNYEAAVKAVEFVDDCLNKVITAIDKQNGTAIIVSDHGNCEQMAYYETGEPYTAHSSNKVPFILVSRKLKDCRLREGGILADIAPTILDIFAIEKPEEMTGSSLII